MNGTNVMVEFMVSAHEQMFDFFPIAKSSASLNPHTHTKVEWLVRLCKGTRMTPLTTHEPKEKTKIFTHGVELQVPDDVGVQEPTYTEAGVRSITSLPQGKEISDRFEGNSQALVLPMPKYHCQPTCPSFGASLSCFIDKDPFVLAFMRTSAMAVGWHLLEQDLIKANMRLLEVMAKATE